jgi:hypothetical protein
MLLLLLLLLLLLRHFTVFGRVWMPCWCVVLSPSSHQLPR